MARKKNNMENQENGRAGCVERDVETLAKLKELRKQAKNMKASMKERAKAMFAITMVTK